jgi:predicted DNA-binding protein
MKSHFVGVRMPLDLVARAKRRAQGDGRSLSNYIKNLIRQNLKTEETPPSYRSNTHCPKKQFSVRLRPDQERRIQLMLDVDPELDSSKIIRKAIGEYLAKRGPNKL